MSALPRGRCCACRVDVALRNGQLAREHRDERGRVCAGSGKKCASPRRRAGKRGAS